MGGKTKQSQRTKNNVRPSSSSRSAELLNGGLSLDGGLMTLGSGKPLPPLFPTLVSANLEQGLNPEFQMCFKKLNKKDPITRAKALQDLCELVNNGNVDDVVAALPSWAHFYKILTTDTDRKVREATQACHGAIVRVCGRRMAPQLKMLLPAWLQAQYDEHAPAQTQAHNSLTSTFPDKKLPEVISFCKSEVMSHLLDNLIGNTEAIVSKRIENAEERELQMNRIISSSLQGLEYFIVHLPSTHDEWLWTALTPLLQANAFWKFAHNTSQVRSAWCGAVGRAAERYGATYGAAHGRRTARLLLDRPDAPAASAALTAPLWACLLHFMHNVPEWHTYLDKKELLVKRLLDVLENGGWGDAKHLSNMLLPLLAYLPQDLLTKDFYGAFFNAMFSGFEKKNILHSKSERQAWITSLAECLRYMSIQQSDYVPEIATSVHRRWLETALSTVHDGPTRNNLIKCSATNMSSLVKYWLKQSKEENSEKYDQLIRNFWQNVGSTVLTQIDKCGTEQKEITNLIEGHILLLQTLKTTFYQEPKKQQSIKFHGDEETVIEKCDVVPQPCDASIADRYKHNLEDVVHKICCHYFETAEKKQVSNAILSSLITLLVEFDSADLFLALAKQFEVDSVYRFYDKVLQMWLRGDTMRCKAIIDIIFLLMKYMSETEQDSMFETFTQFPPSVVEWCLCVCVREPHVRRGAVRRWMRGQHAAAALRRLAARAARAARAACCPTDPSALLLACLTPPADSAEPLVSSPAISDVTTTVCSALSAATTDPGAALEAAGALAARLATALHDLADATYYTDLLMHLFRLNVLVPRGDSRVSVDTWCEIRSSWQDGVAALTDQRRTNLLRQAAAFIQQQLLHTLEEFDITKIENMVSSCPYLFNRSDEAEEPNDVTEVVAFTKHIFDIDDAESVIVESYALRYECVTSQLNCLYDDGSDVTATVIRDASKCDVKELTKKDLMLYVNKYLFRAIYLRTMLLHKINSNEDEDEPSEQKTWCNVLLKDEYLLNEYCKVLHDYVVIESLHQAYAFWAHYDIIVQAKRKGEAIVGDVISATNAECSAAVRSVLESGARKLAKHHALALHHYVWRAKLPEQDQLHTIQHDDDVPDGLFHSLQASTRWSSDEQLSYKVKLVVMLRSWSGAHGGLAPRDVTSGIADTADTAGDGQRTGIDIVIDSYYSHPETMLYDMDISSAEWSVVVSNVSVVELLTHMMTSQDRGWSAPAHHWDFATITLCSLLASVRKSMHCWQSTKVSMLCRSVLRLWASAREAVRAVPARSERDQPAPHVAALPAEWRHVFAPDATYSLLALAAHVLDSCTDNEMTVPQIEVLEELIKCTKLIEWDTLPTAHKLGALSLVRLARCATEALQQPAHHAYKYLAYYLLVALAKPLVLDDAEKLSLWSEESLSEGDEEKERPQFSLDLFRDAFTHIHEIVDAALSTVVLGEGTCEFVAMSDSYSMALGWLLLADVLAELGQLARGDLAQHYVQIYRDCKYVEPLLTSVLRLLPDGVFAFAADNSDNTPAPPQYSHMFLKVKDFSVHEAASGGEIGALACRALYGCVCGPGAGAARGWWAAAAPRAARLLLRPVEAYVAPAAARRQLLAAQRRAHELPDTAVRVALAARELCAVHTVDERAVELRVWLARAHPLVAPRLAAHHAAGPGSNTHWLALYLAYQNGTLLNALKMWTAAVNAKVESSPQCYICYCRLHPTTGRLPRVACHQCRNKFHNLCLRKWFDTSNKSSCPLCRSAF